MVVAKALIWMRFPMYLSLQVPRRQISMWRSSSVLLRSQELSLTRAPLISPETKQYLREQLVHLTEQCSSLTLASTGRIMRDIYTQSLETFIIEKRNLTSLVDEMADYTNRAIMKKLEAIRNLVSISEQSYRRFAETDQETRNATAKFMAVSALLWSALMEFSSSGIRLLQFERWESCCDQCHEWQHHNDIGNGLLVFDVQHEWSDHRTPGKHNSDEWRRTVHRTRKGIQVRSLLREDVQSISRIFQSVGEGIIYSTEKTFRRCFCQYHAQHSTRSDHHLFIE